MGRICFEGSAYWMRHAEADGNADKEMRQNVPDHSLRLTEPGKDQIKRAAAFLVERLSRERDEYPKGFGKIHVIHSPFYRGHEASFYLIQALAAEFGADLVSYEEDPLAFERKFGIFDGVKIENYEEKDPRAFADRAKHEDHHGTVYAIPPFGESYMDVVARVKPGLESTMNGLNLQGIRHAVFLNHAGTMRAQISSIMGYSNHWLEAEDKPGNCWIRHLHSSGSSRFFDDGYIFGDGAPLYDRMATQLLKPGAQDVYMLKPLQPNALIPRGVTNVVDPFKPVPR